MERSNSKATSLTFKYWLIGLGLFLPLLTWGTINTFDLLKANRLDIDNVRIDGNTISTTNTNGDLTLDMNGTGAVILTDLTASTVPYLNASKKITSSSVTDTELAYVHNVTSSLCGISQSCVLTSKTVDADSNTITNIANASIKAAAAIAVNKLQALSTSTAVATDGSGFLTNSTTTGTELSYVHSVTAPIQTQLIIPGKASNCSIAAGIGSSAMTLSIRDSSGSTPSASSPCTVNFRNSTAGSGSNSDISVSASTSTVISSGSTAGHTNATDNYLYVYALNNAGALEVAWSSRLFDIGSLQTTTAEGGAGAADSNTTLYSTTARSSVPIALLARLVSNQTTAGTWAATPTEISPASGTSYKEGLKQYTCTGSGPTGYSVNRFICIPYMTVDGAWRIRFNIDFALTNATTITLTVPWTNKAGYYQALAAGSISSSQTINYCRANDGGTTVSCDLAANTSRMIISGDIELASKPTWAL